MMKNFYHSFEQRYRGSRELVMSRLQVYMQFVGAVIEHQPELPAIDLGCGRGEWLELLAASGAEVLGVDSDSAMLEECNLLGLDATYCDAVDYLIQCDDGQASVISAFHLVEHMEFSRMQRLISEAHRVLCPGGLLILETPNPDNLTVGSKTFYMDPTHVKPIPSELLSFVVESVEFSRTKTLYLQETPEILEAESLGVLDVIAGVSPDYAVVAQKQVDGQLWSALDEPFSLDFGVSLNQLGKKYDQLLEGRFDSSHSLSEEVLKHLADLRQDILHHQSSESEQLLAALDATEGKNSPIGEKLIEVRSLLGAQQQENSILERRLKSLTDDLRREEKTRLKALDSLVAEQELREFMERSNVRLRADLESSNAYVDELGAASHFHYTYAHELERQLESLGSGSSFFITSPLHLVSPKFLVWMFSYYLKRAQNLLLGALKALMWYALQRPMLRRVIVGVTETVPPLHRFFIGFAESTGLVEVATSAQPLSQELVSQQIMDEVRQSLESEEEDGCQIL